MDGKHITGGGVQGPEVKDGKGSITLRPVLYPITVAPITSRQLLRRYGVCTVVEGRIKNES